MPFNKVIINYILETITTPLPQSNTQLYWICKITKCLPTISRQTKDKSIMNFQQAKQKLRESDGIMQMDFAALFLLCKPNKIRWGCAPNPQIIK